MPVLLQEVRSAVRLLRDRPAFCLLVVLTLALGIGANTAVFTLVNAVILRSPAIEQPERLVNLYMSRQDGSGYGALSYPEYRDLAAANAGLRQVFGYSGLMATITGEQGAEVLFGEIVTGTYFPSLGVKPALGRVILPEDDASPGAHPVAVLGHGLWHRRFGADPTIIGRHISLNGHPFTVVGVAPPEFTGLLFPGFAVDVWVPTMMMGQVRQDRLADRGERWLFVRGRLENAADVKAVRASAAVIAARWRQAYPEANRGRELRVLRSLDVRVNAEGDRAVIPAAAALLLAVGLVLLVACANVSGLMLARATSLGREAAVRIALGAGRWRLIARGLAESSVLSLFGAAAGLGLAALLSRLLVAYRPPLPVPIALDLAIDWRVATFTAVLTGATALILGVLPWWHAAKQDPMSAFRADPAWRRRSRCGLRNVLLLPQVTLSFILLVVAALFARSVAGASSVDPGFDSRPAAALTLNLGMSGYDQARSEAFYRELTGRLRQRPDVAAVALTTRVPLDIYGSQSAPIVTDAGPGAESEDAVQVARVGEDYFSSLRIPILQGRAIDARDTSGGVPAAVVSATAARHFWPDVNPLGRRLRLGDGPWLEVVGIAADVKVQTLGEAPQSMVYEPLRAGHAGLLRVVVRRAGGDPSALLPELRRLVSRLDPGVAVFECETLQATLDVMLYPYRLAAYVGAALGLFGLILTSVGLFGVTWAGAVQRAREMGIRAALGARPTRLLSATIRDGMTMVVAGMALGTGAAMPAVSLMRGWLFGIQPIDPVAFSVVPVTLLAVSLIACLVPAARAVRADPAKVLRE
jgi:putative ABC transport system permease protein